MIRSGLRALGEMYALGRDLKDLRVLAASGVVGTLGAGLLNPVLPVYLEAHGLRLEQIGMVFTLGSLLPMVLQPVLGALSDRFRRKWFLIGSSVTTSLLVPLLALLPSPLWLSAALSAKLMLDRSAEPVSSAMVGDFAPKAQRATVFGLLSSAINITFVLALVGSSAALGLLRARGMLYLAGALFLSSSLILLLLREDRGAAEARPLPGEGGAGLRIALRGLLSPVAYVRRDPALLPLFVYQFWFTFALDLFPIYLPLFAVKLGAKAPSVGPLIAASWLVYALVQPAGGRLSDRWARRKGLISCGLAGMAFCAAILGLSGFMGSRYALPVMAFAWVLMAIPDGLFRPAADALLVDLSPAAERGQFMGALGSAASLANVLAPLVYGIAAARMGLSAAFLLSAGALLFALLSIVRVKEPGGRAASLAAAPSEAI